MRSVSNRAQQRGQIRTLLGRLCRFHLWEPNRFGINKALPFEEAILEHGQGNIRRAYTYKALNKLIQGSAADMTKKSMLDLYKEGIIAHIQIHDELDLSVESPDQVKKIIEIMENAVTLEIPNKVDYESGKNWGDIYDQEETMEMIKEAINDLWKNNKKVVIGAGIVVVILIIAAL